MKTHITTFFLSTGLWIPVAIPQSGSGLISSSIEHKPESLTADGIDHATAFLEEIEILENKPLDINGEEVRILVEMGFMSEIQFHALQEYIHAAGRLVEIEELQAVEYFSPEYIRRINPLIAIRGSPSEAVTNPLSLFNKASQQLLMRYSRVLELSRGYRETIYPGDPSRIVMRYTLAAGRDLGIGVTAEKDPGEEFFKGSNAGGFDYYSGHLQLRNPLPGVAELIAGDYSISMGEGLIMHSGFGYGKSAFTTQIKKSARKLKPYKSTGESDYLRGAAIDLRAIPHFRILAFLSSARRDANLLTDSLDNAVHQEISSTAFIASGLHRTEAETEDEKAVLHRTAGMILNYHSVNFEFGANLLFQTFKPSFGQSEALYRKYIHTGTRDLSASANYSWFFRNVHAFGEIAIDDSKDCSFIQGFQVALDEKLDIALLLRWVPPQYFAMQGNYFAETGSGTNEKGLYFGATFSPSPRMMISGYFDCWKHPWLRYTSDAPGRGNEAFCMVSYKVRKQWEMHIQGKYEIKTLNRTGNSEPVDVLRDQIRSQIRFRFKKHWTRAIETRNRLELTWYAFDGASESGFFIAQDVLYKPLGSPFSFTMRFALFETDDYNSRIYTYENDVSYGAGIPAFANKGQRTYWNFRYKGIRNLSLEFRYAQTIYLDRSTSGSGYDEIEKNKRSEIKFQCIWKFPGH